MNSIPSSSPPVPPRSPKGKEKENSQPKVKNSRKVPQGLEKIISETDGTLLKKKPVKAMTEDLEITSNASGSRNLRTPQVEGDEPIAQKWLPKELKEKIQRKELDTIKHKQAKTEQSVSTSGPLFTADPLGDSVNPVGIVRKTTYHLKSSLSSENFPTFPMISNILKKAVLESTGPQSRKKFKQQALFELNKKLQSIYTRDDLSSEEKFEGCKQTFQMFKEHYLVEVDSYDFRDSILKLEQELQQIYPPSDEKISSISTLFNKDEIINQLAFQLESTIEHGSSNKTKVLIKLIRELNQHRDIYISKEDFSNLLNRIEEGVSHKEQKAVGKLINELKAMADIGLLKDEKSFVNISASGFLGGVQPLKFTEYVSSNDVLATVGNNPVIKMKLANSAYYDAGAGYAVKLGSENHRELLARKILSQLGLEEFFHLKTGIELPRTEIKGRQAHDAIASSLIEGHPLSNDRNWSIAWKAFQKAEFQLNKAIYENKSEEEIHSLQFLRDQAAEELKDLGGRASIPVHVLVSALLGGYDEHSGQYILDSNKELVNIDFSRFLPPSPYLKNQTENETLFIFRNVLLNHPSSRDPLPKNVVEIIKKWDLLEMQKEMNALCGDSEVMEENYRKLQKINRDFKILRALDDAVTPEERKEAKLAIVNLLLEHKIVDSPEQITNFHLRELKEQLRQENKNIRMASFDSIHPEAAKDLITRMTLLQDYVTTESNPSAYGAFTKMYPEIMPFIEYMQHTRGLSEVGEEVSMMVHEKAGKQQTAPRSLESILKNAISTLANRYKLEDKDPSLEEIERRKQDDEKLQSEIDAMKKGLEMMQTKARYRDEISLTMDLS